MSDLISIENKKINNTPFIFENLYKGAYVKIKNSNKTFQVIGINPLNKMCWIREWPIAYADKKTFALNISQITIQVLCTNDFTKEVII